MAIQLIVHTTFHVKACMFYVLQHRVHLCMNSAHWGNSRKSHFDDIHLYHCMLHLPPYCCYRYLGFPSTHLIAPSHNCTTFDVDTDFATPLTNSFFRGIVGWWWSSYIHIFPSYVHWNQVCIWSMSNWILTACWI